MSESTLTTLMTKTLIESVEEQQVEFPSRAETLPSLNDVLKDAAHLPNESLFLGVAQDGLPILLNIYDPIPGPILITGDEGSGKTRFLKMIASAAEIMHSPSQVLHTVITTKPEEWNVFIDSKSNVGIHEARTSSAETLLQGLVNWAHNNKGEEESILLFIDDLEALIRLDNSAQQNLRWILLRGTSRRIWTFVTLNASRAREVAIWLDFFRTRLLGHIQNTDDAEIIAGEPNEIFSNLISGTEFSMREENNWLNFWIPVFEE